MGSGSAAKRVSFIMEVNPRTVIFFRSAGACPPRALERAKDGEGQALALR